MNTITINGKKYSYRFGMSVLRRVSVRLGKPKVNDVIKVFSNIKYSDPSPEDLEALSALFLFGLQRGAEIKEEEINLIEDDILDAIYYDPKSFEEMLNAFVESLGSGNQNAPKKKGARA